MNINQLLEQIDIEMGSLAIDNLTEHQWECFRKIDRYLHDIEQLLGQSYCYFEEDIVEIKKRNKPRISNPISFGNQLRMMEDNDKCSLSKEEIEHCKSIYEKYNNKNV